MLFAASESAVTKKPRLRLIRRRSSSDRPFGVFQSAMSRSMLISCGIQWFAQPARYFSHAHLYLNGTSWLTSAAPLMIRLSSTRTRRVSFDTIVPECRRCASSTAAGGAIAMSSAFAGSAARAATPARPSEVGVGAAEAGTAATGRMAVAGGSVAGRGAGPAAGWSGLAGIGSSQDSI